MKKILIIMMMFTIVMSLNAYTIETSKGSIELTIPDGYSLEEAYCQMAKLYLEERWDHESLIESSKKLTEDVDKYITENKELRSSYDKLNDSYENIIRLYKEKTKISFSQPFIGCHIGSDSGFNSYSFGLDFGTILYDKIITYSSISYPWQLRLGLDIKI